VRRILAAVALGVALAATPGAARAATGVRPEAGGAYAGALQLNATPQAMVKWGEGYSCSGDVVNAPRVSLGFLDLHATGASNQCEVVSSPAAYLYGVIEYRIWVQTTGGLISDWPAAWARGGTWDTPSYQEIDAFEGLSGYDQSSYWTGNGVPAGDDVTGYSTGGTGNGGGYNSVGIPRGAPVTGAWNTVDIVWSPSSFTVYDNGRVFASIPESEATPMNLIVDNTEWTPGLQPGVSSNLYVAWIREWSYS
jgi:hypothetical protein